MRMRKKKNGSARLEACRELLYSHGGAPLTAPAEVFGKSAPVYLEIGAGKGGFASGMLKKEPEVAYFAMERVSDCVTLAAERAKSEALHKSLRFIVDTADNLSYIFADGVIDKIFLNFSDPWSKKGYAKRRLMHRRYLSVYLNLLKEGTFKTDNVGLFDFALLEIEAMGLAPVKLTRDLHASEWNEGNVVTEYEKNFSDMGVPINMVEIVKPKGYICKMAEELSRERPDRRSLAKKSDRRTDEEVQ